MVAETEMDDARKEINALIKNGDEQGRAVALVLTAIVSSLQDLKRENAKARETILSLQKEIQDIHNIVAPLKTMASVRVGVIWIAGIASAIVAIVSVWKLIK